MASTKWTPAQAAAIADRGGSLLVSAAAGSGKTAVLTERVVELLKDTAHPIQADRLLIVTFTNAAAAELRARISARIEQVLLEQPNDQRLRRQKMLLQRANICTIDAFCLQLLQQHFTALDIPPDFSLADAGVVGRLKSQALAQTLEESYQDADFRAFADLYGKARNDGAASAAVLQLYEFLRTLPAPQQVKQQMLAQWQGSGEAGFACWNNYLMQRASFYAQYILETVQTTLHSLDAALQEDKINAFESKKTPAARQKAAKTVEEKYDLAENCLVDFFKRMEQVTQWLQVLGGINEGQGVDDSNAQHNQDSADTQNDARQKNRQTSEEAWDALYNFFAPYQKGEQPLPGLKGAKIRMPKGQGDAIAQASNRASEAFETLMQFIPCNMAQFTADATKAAPMIAALMQAETRFSDLFYQKKLEKKMLEFSDLEHLALQLLQPKDGVRTPLATSISGGFDAVMVDEYQDTNALQEALYLCLANPAGDNLFFVGDIKQSIYRFRKADPSIFARKQNTFAPLEGLQPRPAPSEGQAGSNGMIALDANFRSSPAVIDGVNFIFLRAFWGGSEPICYQEQQLVCGAKGAIDGSVSLLIDTEGGRDPAQIAEKIAQLMELGANGEAAGMVRDGDTVRPVRYEDCCILLSTRAPFAKYADALAAQGIPTYADSSEDLLSVAHIQPLIALIKIIDNPAQDIPLAAAMLSVIFGFTEDDLVALRLRCPRGSLYGAVVQVAAQAQQQSTQQQKDALVQAMGSTPMQESDVPADAFVQKVAHFYQTLSALRRLSHTLAPEELLAEIFATTHYLALVGAMPDGQRRREDVSKFVAFAVGAGANGIESLVHNIEQTEASGGLVDSAPSKIKPGCVTIMTIHRSKGLQFPVVFVANLDHRFNTMDANKKMMLHPHLGLGLQLRMQQEGGNYHTLSSIALRQAEQEELRSEAMRLLYVALTRAQDHLYMSGSFKGLEKYLAEMAKSDFKLMDRFGWSEASSFMQWVVLALVWHPGAAVLSELCEAPMPHPFAAEYPLTITCLAASQAEDLAPERPKGLTATPDPALVQRLMDGFAWQYPNAALTKLPAKVSVTSLVHKEQATILARPAFMAKDGMTAAEKGTALHAFLENADFETLKQARQVGATALKAALRAEQQCQEAERRILPELAEKLDMASVETFFEGEAFARIAAATEVYREYAFITGLPANEVLAATGATTDAAGAATGMVTDVQVATQDAVAHKELATTQFAPVGNQMPQNQGVPHQNSTVLVQGIADLLLVYPDHLELLDYKSDHGKKEDAYRKAYAKQLAYYAKAIEKRFAPLAITYRAIYSFDLGRLIEMRPEDCEI